MEGGAIEVTFGIEGQAAGGIAPVTPAREAMEHTFGPRTSPAAPGILRIVFGALRYWTTAHAVVSSAVQPENHSVSTGSAIGSGSIKVAFRIDYQAGLRIGPVTPAGESVEQILLVLRSCSWREQYCGNDGQAKRGNANQEPPPWES